MAEPEKRRNVLLYLAAEGAIPVLGGCAGVLAGGPVGGFAGVAVGQAVEKAINLFGRGIADRWQEWFAKNPESAHAAVAELAALSQADAHKEAQRFVLELAPDAATPDIDLAVEFLSAIPKAVDRALVPNPTGAGRSIPPTVAFDDPRSLLQLLPEDVPPYPASAEIPGTPYRLVELLGSGGFGAVYRAVSPTLQHLPLAIKFCLDRSLLPALNQERSNLERLMRASGAGARHVVRLYGYDLDHATPYLVYEYIEGGDLTRLMAARRMALGRPPGAAEVLGWVVQLAEGLAFAHQAGLVHRDLKPANILADGDTLKLADFGLGGVAVARAAARSRIGTTTLDYLSLAEQASLFRGAGTPLYMSPEQRRGAPPEPRHDLYALGVMWYQLLTGDVSRELHHGWAKELAVRFGVPTAHIGLIERCVGWYEERPKDANELLPLLTGALLHASPGNEGGEGLPVPAGDEGDRAGSHPETILNASQSTSVASQKTSELRQSLLVSIVGKLHAALTRLTGLESVNLTRSLVWGFPLALVLGWIAGELHYVRWSLSEIQRSFPNAFGQVPFEILSVLVGVLLGLAAWISIPALVWLMTRIRAEIAKAQAEAVSEELEAEFPAEVAAWGGAAVLRDAGIVRRIQHDLNPPAALPPSSTSALSLDEVTADPTRKALLLARLREHAKLLVDTNDKLDQAWVGLAMLWIIVAPAIGVLFSAIPYLWDSSGGSNRTVMVVFGVFGGVLAAVGAWFLVATLRRDLARKRESGIDRLAADYSRMVESWGGRIVLENLEQITALARTIDPTASSIRPGFFRRMLGA